MLILFNSLGEQDFPSTSPEGWQQKTIITLYFFEELKERILIP